MTLKTKTRIPLTTKFLLPPSRGCDVDKGVNNSPFGT